MAAPGDAPPMQFSAPSAGHEGRFASVDAYRQQAAGQQQQQGGAFKDQLWQLNQDIEGFSRRLSVNSGVPGPGAASPGAGDSSRLLSARPSAMISGIPATASVAVLPASGPPAAAAAARDSAAASQLGSLYQTMGPASSHLDPESVQKRKMQDEIDQLKLQMTMSAVNTSNAMGTMNTFNAQQSTHMSSLEKELKDKTEEIAALREEKAVMKEWLDRGVNECRRVAEEVQRLRREIDDSDGDRGRLEEEKTRLEAMLQQVMQDVRDTSGQLEKEKTDKETILASALADKEAALGNLNTTERSMMLGAEKLRLTQVECERLATEVARQMERIREMEEGEMYLRALVCGLKRVAHGFVTFHTAVEEDRVADFTGAHTAADEAEVDAAGSGPLDGVANNGKACLAELQDVLLALRSAVRGRLEETKERCVTVQRREAEAAHTAVEGAKRVERDLRERHSIEKRLLEEKLEELEAELSGLSEEHIRARRHLDEQAAQHSHELHAAMAPAQAAMPAAAAASPPQHERHFVDQVAGGGTGDTGLAQAKVVALQAKCAKLEQSNAKLKEKNKKMKVDWGKVSDTRTHCQKLEIEKRTMQTYIDKVEMENEALRRRLFNSNIASGGSVAAMNAPRALSPTAQLEQDRSSAVWRDWQNAQSGWEDWKESAVRRGAPTSPAATTRPHPAGHALFQTPSTQLSMRPTSPPATGPWMPQS
eukprot:TRINITY_DN30021_c0_g1_i1.p1 TRINITY_DN30021_c0_g1~~TRINITY_DN30021_c0_g1_i1.p1  ORF type:complete len:708 (+),score=272.22 TRINITY_DN30021_c0_g1_i1:59-2182(+)